MFIFFRYFTSDQLGQLTSTAIMDLYPEILDPEYDPKKKKQRVITIYSYQ